MIAAALNEKELYARIGHLLMEMDWLQKNLARLGVWERLGLIETKHPRLSVAGPDELSEPAAFDLLPPTGARPGREPRADAVDRRDVSGVPFLR